MALVFLAACVEHAYIHTYIHDTQILSPDTIPQIFFLALFCLASVYSSIPGKSGSKMSTHVLICFTLRRRGNSFRIMEPAILRKTNLPKMLKSCSLDFLKSGWGWIVGFVFPFLKLHSTSLSNLEKQSRLTHSPLSNQSSSISDTQVIETSCNNFSLIKSTGLKTYNKHRFCKREGRDLKT